MYHRGKVTRGVYLPADQHCIMLYFYVDKVKRAKKGVPPERFTPERLYRTHLEAQEDERGKVLVVDLAKIDAPMNAPLDALEALPEKALLNVKPYLPTREVLAGGGIITRMGKKNLKVLLIFRKGKWDIPKGKQEPGESIKKCAKREVCEELGIPKVKVIQFLDTTVHGYREPDAFIVKTTYWYHMSTTSETFVPQAEEKITDVKWFSINKARRVLGHVTLVHLLDRVEPELMKAH